jgi:putative Ca2+/H+ antiporter (TMEM165/GDT1 family)
VEQGRSLVLIAAFALAMAALGQSRAIQPSSDNNKSDAPKTEQPAPKNETEPTPASTPAIEEPLKALDVLAEALGTEITVDAIHRRLAREAKLARTLNESDARVGEAKRLLRQFATNAYSSVAANHGVAVPTVEEIDRYFARPATVHSQTLARLQVAVLQEVAHRQATQVRFLITTLPDAIDSYSGWQFDLMLDAIAQGAAASDFMYDRSQLPDSAQHQNAAAADRGTEHERQSSAVIFHQHFHAQDKNGHTSGGPAASEDERQLVVLLIVHENPSSGLLLPALLDALRVVTLWGDQPSPEHGPGQCIAILGPTFSRSADSIARALQMAYRRQMFDHVSQVRVLSGSATDESNKGLIEHALDGPNRAPAVSFHATVQPDGVVLPELVSFVQSRGWSERVAVLFEGNTQYGRSLGALVAQPGTSRWMKPILLPFPLNVSHIRDTAQDEKLGLSQALGLPPKFRPLSMDAPPMPVDQIPQLSPETTSSYVELDLSTLLKTMRSERLGTVALMSTDPRDKLFLASRVAQEAPNLSIMTIDSDAIYAHPDYAYYMQGTVVASTYALYSGTQQWSYELGDDRERHVFANGSAEGVYNAAVLLLNYDSLGRPANDQAPRPVDYGVPGEACVDGCEPPVWISVVGSGSAWPLKPTRVARPRDDDVKSAYIQRVFGADTWSSHTLSIETFPSSAFVAVLIVVNVVLLFVWADKVLRSGRWANVLFGRARSCAAEDRWRRRAYALVAVWSLIAIDAFLGTVWLLHIRVQDQNALSATTVSRLSWFVGVAFGVPLAAVQVQIIQYVVRSERAWTWLALNRWSAGRWARLTAGGLGLWAMGNLVAYLWTCLALPPAGAASFVVRATDLNNGVSPTLPIVFLFLAFGLWGVIEMLRLRGHRTALADSAVQALMRQAVSGRLDKEVGDWTRLSPSMLATPPAVAGIVVIGLAATCFALFDPFVRPLVTTEGVVFGRVISTAILVLQVMTGLALLQFVYLWWLLKRLLERLAHHSGADGYTKVPRGLFPARLFPQRPTFDDLEVLVECRMACLSRSHLGGAAELHRMFESERIAAERPHWSASATWTALLSAATMPPAADGTVSSPACDLLRLREMCVTLAVRDAIARLWHNVVFVIGAVLCVFSAHTLFPFRLQRALGEVGWFYVALAFGAILTVLIQMRGNELLRRVASPDPTKAGGWDTGFILRLAIFVLVPLLALFAAQFPDAGGVLMRWLEPVRKILP